MQTILSGMGDLHLDIILNRIKSEYKVDASLGRLQVAYRESPTKTATINGIVKYMYCTCGYSLLYNLSFCCA